MGLKVFPCRIMKQADNIGLLIDSDQPRTSQNNSIGAPEVSWVKC
jgi:hypothetical protein